LGVIGIAGQTGRTQVTLAYVGRQDKQLLGQIVALGDMSRRTLGFLPQVAFLQAADSGTLLAAIRDGQVLGYALYSLPRQVVRLTHLCVSEDARGQGIARRLVEAISDRHADRFGITLKCRKDYPANDLWPVLGFAPQGEVRGRSRQRLPLTVWWRDHGHPNLFSATESMGLLRVAVDVNVFLDLESASERHGVIASRALAGDWLTDQLELVVTGELMRELARMPGGQEKSHQHQAASKYTRLAVDGGAAETLARHISEHVLKTQAIDLSVDPADQSDVRHVAEASLAGVTVLATKDDTLLQWAAGAIGITGGLPLPTGLECCDRALGQHQGAARCGSFGVASPARRSPDVDGRAIQVDQVPPATTSTCTATPRPSGGRGWPANCPAVLSTPGITRPRRRPANWP
jgi:GNAT superfamily N-acetyltransferase